MQIISAGKVKIKGYGNDRMWFEVGSGDNKVLVTKIKTRTGDFYECTCKHHSIFGPDAGMCTFVKTVITYSSLGVKIDKDKHKQPLFGKK